MINSPDNQQFFPYNFLGQINSDVLTSAKLSMYLNMNLRFNVKQMCLWIPQEANTMDLDLYNLQAAQNLCVCVWHKYTP